MADATDGSRVLARSDHPISRKQIDLNAIKVLYRLHHAGYQAYLVGGAVRDLMLNRRPKDFDISTNARPQEIRRLFRNSRIIGRRFRLAHIYFRDGIIEVSTFRRNPDPGDQASGPGELLITDDNVFGTPRQDAFRRDFTVNALIYNIADFSVVDYVDGIQDLDQRVIRVIGDPDLRFREDPVRMLRACEMAGRLDFRIDAEAVAAIRRNVGEIEKASPARLSEEIGQILQSGSAAPILRRARDVGLLEVFLPEAYNVLTVADEAAVGFQRIPEILDRMTASGRNLSESVLLGSLLLPSILLRRRDIEALNQRPIWRSALRSLNEDSVAAFAQRFALARAKTEGLHQVLWAFHRLGERWPSAASRMQFARQAGFDDALALLEVMVSATGGGSDTLEVWQQIQDVRPEAPTAKRTPRRRQKRRRRHRRGTP
jgi:poly(A) polymerase